MKRMLGAVALAAMLGGAAAAQTVDGATARAALYPVKGVKVVVFNLPTLSQKDRIVLSELAKQQKYYGAIALSPDEGLMAEPTLAAANYHSIPPAEAAARAACDRARKRGTAPCVIAAHILPADHRPRAVQLSVDATAAFRKNGTGGGPKALAISPATGQWAMAVGQGAEAAALAGCRSKATVNAGSDCRVTISD